MTYDIKAIRSHIPALSQTLNDQPVVYLNGPGGTQVPQCVAQAMSDYLLHSNSNLGGPFSASIDTAELYDDAHKAAAAFINAPDWREISFGANMTTLTFAFSRCLSKTWPNSGNIILTELEHDANIAPWLLAAEDHGLEVRYWPVNLDTFKLELDDLENLIDDNTVFLSMTLANNLIGSHVDAKGATAIAKKHGIEVFVDATHACAHIPIDVQDIDCDYLACSAYKFSGPHIGMLFGKLALREKLMPYKLPLAPNVCPYKWELGTQNFEGLAGLIAILKYKAAIVGGELNTQDLHAAMRLIGEYELTLINAFTEGLNTKSNISWYGIKDEPTARTATFGLRVDGESPADTSKRLAEQGFFTSAGSFYCQGLLKRLGFLENGGLCRVGFAYYNTLEEVERLLNIL